MLDALRNISYEHSRKATVGSAEKHFLPMMAKSW